MDTGTSLPNYVASKVAAEQGFGNQAVSNAFGRWVLVGLMLKLVFHAVAY
jgi:Ca2+/Na+ antiporter